MSLDNPKKASPQDIETTKEDEIWDSFNEPSSDANLEGVFDDVLHKISFEPDLYFLESTETGASVKKRSDNSIIYFTKAPDEIRTLIKARDLSR